MKPPRSRGFDWIDAIIFGLFGLMIVALVSILTSCISRSEEDRRTATANSAATIYEAASAIEQGAPQGPPLNAIKSNASAIANAQGHPYPPPTSAP